MNLLVSVAQRTIAKLIPASWGLQAQSYNRISTHERIHIYEKLPLSGDNESKEKERDKKRFQKEKKEMNLCCFYL